LLEHTKWLGLPNNKRYVRSPPRAVLRGFHADIVSWPMKIHTMGQYLFSLSESEKIFGKKHRKSFHWLKGIHCSKCGSWHNEAHKSSSSSSAAWSFTEKKSDPLFAKSVAPIIIADPMRNSFLVNSLHLAFEDISFI
jgi:hypothetical protein